MSPFAQAIAQSLAGALMIMTGNRSGLAMIDQSPTGARFAFMALFYTLPVTLFSAGLIGGSTVEIRPVLVQFLTLATLTELISWSALMLLALRIGDRIGQGGGAVGFVAVYSWSRCWQVTVELLLTVLVFSGVLGGGFGFGIILGVQGFLVVHSWAIARLTVPYRPDFAFTTIIARMLIGGLIGALLLIPFLSRTLSQANGA